MLNSGKTKCMVFSNTRHVTNHVIATLAGHTIDQVKVYKYLGVWVDVENLIGLVRKELVRCT